MEIAAETGLVAWDAAAEREHFVRTVEFTGAATPVAFVVPTPHQPEVAEADASIFAALARVSQPTVVTSVSRPVQVRSALTRSAPLSAQVEEIAVLETAHVAGYDAISLRADDPSALAEWLAEHGFQDRPSTAAWLAPYVAQHWVLTVFRFAPGPGETVAGTEGDSPQLRDEGAVLA